MEISDRGGPLGAGTHVGLAAALFVAGLALVRGLRARASRSVRTFALAIAAWAVAEALAVAGLAVALVLAPAPRLALTVYFTGALLLWLRSRP